MRPYIRLVPNSVTTIMDVDGPATITHIWITVHASYYRDLIIRAYWDQEEEPSVEVPLGDLFCVPFDNHDDLVSTQINAIPINVNHRGGLNCFFPMPFRKHAKITVENRRPDESPLFFYAISYELGEVEDDEIYFHAQFRRSNPLKYMEDYVIVDNIKGKGHYVGTHMNWQQNNKGWFGEGEIKAFIDGDGEFPTYCGTGTEDYFGGAWCYRDDYTAPYFGYRTVNRYPGAELPYQYRPGDRHSMYRYHIMDPICFERDLKVTMQALGWRSEHRFLPLQDDISSVAFWYQAEPHNPFPELGSRNDLEII